MSMLKRELYSYIDENGIDGIGTLFNFIASDLKTMKFKVLLILLVILMAGGLWYYFLFKKGDMDITVVVGISLSVIFISRFFRFLFIERIYKVVLDYKEEIEIVLLSQYMNKENKKAKILKLIKEFSQILSVLLQARPIDVISALITRDKHELNLLLS